MGLFHKYLRNPGRLASYKDLQVFKDHKTHLPKPLRADDLSSYEKSLGRRLKGSWRLVEINCCPNCKYKKAWKNDDLDHLLCYRCRAKVDYKSEK